MLMIHFAQNIAFAPSLRQHIDASEGGLSVILNIGDSSSTSKYYYHRTSCSTNSVRLCKNTNH